MFTFVTVVNDFVVRFIDPGFHHYNSAARYVGCVAVALVFTFLKPYKLKSGSSAEASKGSGV